MANICRNEFYCCSDDPKNIDYVTKFLEDNLGADIDRDVDYVDAYFDSRWTFPEELMDEMYKGLPNKEDFYARCLSVEYGCDYVDYHKCEDNGWYVAL